MSAVSHATRVAPTQSATAHQGKQGAAASASDAASAADAFAALLDGLTAALAPADGTADTAGQAMESAQGEGEAATDAMLPELAAQADRAQASPTAVLPTAQPGVQAQALQLLGPDGKLPAGGQPAEASGNAPATSTLTLADGNSAQRKPAAAQADALQAATAPAAQAAPAKAQATPAFADMVQMARADKPRSESSDSRLPETMPLTAAAPPSPVGLPMRTEAAAPVHQAALLSQPQDAAFAGDLAAEVRFLVDAGIQKAELRLNPADLGPIHIQMQISAQTADISFSAAHAATRDGINDALPALRDMLASQGLQLGQAGVSSGQQQQQQDARATQDAPRGRSTTVRGDAVAAAAAPLGSTLRLAAGRGMLDLYA